MENEDRCNIYLLDLPESTLDCILKHLSPIELSIMSQVCTCLRDRCTSNHLWEQHIKRKWGRVIGDVAYKEWQWHITIAKEENLLNQHIVENGSLGSFTGSWPNLCLGSYLENCRQLRGLSSNNVMMALYISLETGRFWFPAQVCKISGRITAYYFHALLSYDSKTDAFQARQRHGGWWIKSRKIEWDMVRVPPLETCPYALHFSECLDSLKPGDHIEIQQRASSELPYDWIYGVIDHLESCDKNESHCRCHYSDTLVVESKQLSPRSRRRRMVVSRKKGKVEGDRLVGFYGGIRKISSEEEIEMWKKLHAPRTPRTLAPGVFILPMASPPAPAPYPLHDPH